MTSPAVSVILPAHNEASALPVLVAQIVKVLDGWTYELIIVDDGSKDGTWAVIAGLQAQFAAVRGIRLTRNFGHQAALAAGLRAARGSAVITMDGDGQHPPGLLPVLLRLWEDGHAVVQTQRLPSRSEGPLKSVTSRHFYRAWSALSGVPIVRGVSDFRLLDRGVLDAVLASGGPLMFLRGLIHWMGYDIRYVPFEAGPRIGGAPSYTWRRMLSFSVDALTEFSVVPLRLATALGVSVSAISFAYLCYVVAVRLFSNDVIVGWASTAGLIAFLGGIQLFTIGVLGEYVGRVFLRSMDRPQFVVAERTDDAQAGAGQRAANLRDPSALPFTTLTPGPRAVSQRRALQVVPPAPGA